MAELDLGEKKQRAHFFSPLYRPSKVKGENNFLWFIVMRSRKKERKNFKIAKLTSTFCCEDVHRAAFALNYCNFCFFPVTDAFIILTVVFIAPRNPLNIYMVSHSLFLYGLMHCKCQLQVYVVLLLCLCRLLCCCALRCQETHMQPVLHCSGFVTR